MMAALAGVGAITALPTEPRAMPPVIELKSNGIFDFGEDEDEDDELVDELAPNDGDGDAGIDTSRKDETAAHKQTSNKPKTDADFDDDELDALAEADVLRPVDNTINATSTKAASPAKVALNALGSKKVVQDLDADFDLDAEIAAYEAEQAQLSKEAVAPVKAPPAATQRSVQPPAQQRPRMPAQPVLKSKSMPILEGAAAPVDTPESSIASLTWLAAKIRMRRREEAERPAPPRVPARTLQRSATDSALWVDKHRPQHFTELLGDDRLHRDAMSWLKQWDQCVFKRKPKKRPRDAQPGTGGNGFGFGADAGKVPWSDPWGRPQERVLLISGPPGLGKTTLAHIIATQAGYNVFELNASDSRNAGAVDNIVKMALQSASLKDPTKPTLVLVDEIDGATGGAGPGAGGSDAAGGDTGFVRALIKLIEGGRGPRGGKFKERDKKNGSRPLLRPIICVCNDAYAPALRGLRPMAKMIRYHRPATQVLVKRLKEVCEVEEMRADTRSLSLLVDLTQGDIRACINALQFLKTRSSSITEKDVHGAASALGLKDGGANIHRVWDVLFHAPSSRERARSLEPRDARRITDKIVREASLCGDFDKVALGCFEHYPKLTLVDDGWARFKEAHEWLYFAGSLQESVWKSGGGGMFDLLAYVPWTFVPWHNLFANTKNAMPEYPRGDYENFVKRTAFSEISTSLHASLPPTLRAHFNAVSVVTELGPSLVRMLNPDLRPVNNQLVRVEERRVLASLINIMIHLNLRFIQNRTEDGALVMRVEPPLDAFVQYDGRRSKDVAASRFAVRQIVVKEMEIEIRRRRAGLSDASGGGAEARSAGAQKVLAPYLPSGSHDPSSSDANQDDEAASGGGSGIKLKTRIGEKAAVDFFGRAVVPKKNKGSASASSSSLKTLGFDETDLNGGAASKNAGSAGSEDGEPPSKKLKVYFRYHEGFSNAVRKKITLSQLL